MLRLLSPFSEKIYYRTRKGDGKLFNNNKYKNGAFWGTIIGTSIGIVISSKMGPLNSRKMMRSARKVKSNFKGGMNSLWK